MSYTRILLAMFTPVILSACASSSLLPATGNALLSAKEAYEKVDKVRTLAEGVMVLMCTEVPPPKICTEAESALRNARETQLTAGQILNVAIDTYTRINKEIGK